MQKQVHSREFKLDIVRQVATGQKRPAQVCREYGIAESVLSRWSRNEEKQHFIHHKEMGQQRRNSGL